MVVQAKGFTNCNVVVRLINGQHSNLTNLSLTCPKIIVERKASASTHPCHFEQYPVAKMGANWEHYPVAK